MEEANATFLNWMMLLNRDPTATVPTIRQAPRPETCCIHKTSVKIVYD